MFKKKYDPNFFEIPFRPPYELWEAGCWAAAAAVELMILANSPFPKYPFHVAIAVCLGMAVWRGLQGYPYWRNLRALTVRKPIFTTVNDLERKGQELKSEGFYIGEGYQIDTTASEKIHEVIRRGPERILPKRATVGCPWLQRIETPHDMSIPLKFLEGQTLIVGATGAGKTVAFGTFITQAVQRGDAVIIIDPKGDHGMEDAAREACEALGRPDKFMYFNPAFPERSIKIDPLANFQRITEPASRLAALIPSETGSDPFTAFGWNCLNAIGQALNSIMIKPTLTQYVQYLEGTPELFVEQVMQAYFIREYGKEWEKKVEPYVKKFASKGTAFAYAHYYRQHMSKDHQNRVVEALLSIHEHNREHFGKMVASLIPVLNMLTTSPLDALLSCTDPEEEVWDFARIISFGNVCYCALDSLSDKTIGSAVGSMFLADLTAVCGQRYNSNVGDERRVWIFIDEAAEVINDPCIQILNKGRGSYFHAMLATQTLADFEARTGSAAKARQVLGNVNNTFCFRVKDGDTRDYIAEKMPKTNVRTFQRNFQAGTGSAKAQHYQGSYSEQVKVEEVDIIPPSLLESLPDWEYIATFTDGRVLKGQMPLRPRKPKGSGAVSRTPVVDSSDHRTLEFMQHPLVPLTPEADPELDELPPAKPPRSQAK